MKQKFEIMLKPFFIISAICVVFISAAQKPINQSLKNAKGQEHLLGEVTVKRLSEAPFDGWFTKKTNAHKLDLASIEGIKLPDSVTIFMGTWCGDSRKNVPAFIKILKAKNFDLNKLKIICLNTGFQNYKQAPFREERAMGLHRVPLFVFHNKDGKEVGRIVEEPIETLEKDLAKIMKGENYTPSYPIVYDLSKLINKETITQLEKKEKNLLSKYEPIKSSKYELNTYGYKLWTAFRLVEAEFVFNLNTKLFPNESSTFSTLAGLKQNIGKFKEAKKLLNKAIALKPDDENLKTKLNELLKLMN